MAACDTEVRIGVVGDFDDRRPTHRATNAAIAHAAAGARRRAAVSWLPTDSLDGDTAPALDEYDGFVIAPGSPYRSLHGALRAIRFARETNVPLLGTCGGFQHVVLEYARNVAGLSDAEHAESAPDAPRPVITPLACSLAGQRGPVILDPTSQIRRLYKATVVEEEYRCSFGLNPSFRRALADTGLRVSGCDAAGAVRVVELPSLRFFIATLYVPQLSSQPDRPHPLFTAFLDATRRNESNVD